MAIAPLVLTDFGPTTGSGRLAFAEPMEVITAYQTGDVRAALSAAEKRALEGYFAVGFVAYDAAPAFDPALRVAPGTNPHLPLAWFAIYKTPSEMLPATRCLPEALSWNPHVGRHDYTRSIDTIRRRIEEGAFYQVNQTIRLRADWTGSALDMYEALRRAQPSSYGMYIDTGRFQFLSVSPELFFERAGQKIAMRPMKGTARRGRWAAEDAAARSLLQSSVKDRAENVMIVDLVRNDLGRIAEIGTVDVPQLFEIERHPTVWQMTSTVTATLRSGTSLVDVFTALFPSGSIIGAPKIAAASWIADDEGVPRGLYCGAMGIIRPGGDCVFNVAIRTLTIDSETGIAEYGTGGGITIDSTADGEYDELLAKAAVLTRVQPEFELLETLRLSDGVFTHRERHVRRVESSAAYFSFPDDTANAFSAALDTRARLSPTGDYRVRVVISLKGDVQIHATPIAPLGTSPRLSCALSTQPVFSEDTFLFHKTTHRRTYDDRRAAHPDAGEVILVNERGELTECSIGNLVVEIEGELVTPPVCCGLLPGVFREHLLEHGVIHERVLHGDDLERATSIWLVNSVREWVGLDLVDGKINEPAHSILARANVS